MLIIIIITYLDDLNTLSWNILYTDYDKNHTSTRINGETYHNSLGIDDIFEVIDQEANYNGFDRSIMGGFYKDFNNEGQKLSIEVDKNREVHNGNELAYVPTSEQEVHSQTNITIDYEHPLKSDFEGRDKILEVGFKDSQHNHETNFNYNNTHNYIFQYQRDILAVYFNLSHYFTKDFGIQVGTRIEQSNRSFWPNASSIDYNNNEDDIFIYFINQLASAGNKIKKSNIYPSFYLHYDLYDKGQIKFGIGKRIERPGDWSLAPVPHSFSDTKNFRVGNPNLLPEEILKYEISYSNRFPFGYLSTTFYFNSLKNVIDHDVDEIQLTENGKIYEILSYDNLARTEDTGLDIFFMTQPKEWLDLKVMAGINYRKTIEAIEFDQQGSETGLWFRIMSDFSIRDDMKLELSSMLWQARITTGKIHPMKFLGLAFKKDFAKKYSLTFKVNDLLNTGAFSITQNYYSPDTGYQKYMNYEGRRNSRNFTLSLQYKFGDFKENKFKRSSDDHNKGGGDMDYGY